MIRVADLNNETINGLEPILLVPDEISDKHLKKLKSNYKEGTQFISALWFYFSVFYNYELPIQPFVITTSQEQERSAERSSRIMGLLLDCLTYFEGFEIINETYAQRKVKILEYLQSQKARK